MNLLLGVLSGASSAALTTPTDVLKVRMQVYIVGNDLVSVLSFVGKRTGQPFHFPPIQAQTGRANHEMGLFACFADIYRNEGLKGLWRGVGPTAQRAAVVVGKHFTKKNQAVNK